MGARMSRGGGRLLLGRWTYEKFEDAWQKQPEDNPIRQVLEASTKYVVSRSPGSSGGRTPSSSRATPSRPWPTSRPARTATS